MDKATRIKVWNKYDKHCAYCPKKIKFNDMQVDHIHPKNRGGINDISNYNPACRSCNATKSSYTIEEFRQRLIDDVERLRRDSSKFRILERFGIVAQTTKELKFYNEELK